MALSVIKDIRNIYAGLNADKIRADASRTLRIGLQANGEEGYQLMERFLAPPLHRAVEIHRVNGAPPADFDLVLCEPGIPTPANGSRFDPGNPQNTIDAVLDNNSEIEIALASTFPHFRKAVSQQVISRVSRENAMFALVTALPNVIPSVIDLPWAIGEFATDTAFLTMNQLRMAMMLAAAHNRPVGYNAQKMEMAAIIGSAFGWRALARELIGKIPLGGGLIPKAAVAFAGTWVVGLGLEKLNRAGSGLSRAEKRDAYVAALARGREVVRALAPSFSRHPKG